MVKWNAVAPHGILSVPPRGNTNLDIITEYQSISSTKISDAFSTRTKYFAIKNNKAFYAMLSNSVTRTICDTVFDQAQILSTEKYGVEIFKLFTLFTVVSSLQLSTISFNQITSLLL